MAEPRLFREAADRLRRGERLAVIVVVHRAGHTPGAAHAAMLLGDREGCRGTIGGGSVELDASRRARTRLAACGAGGVRASWTSYALDDRLIGQESGMICAGRQDVATVLLDASDLPAVERLAEASPAGPVLLRLGSEGLSSSGVHGDADPGWRAGAEGDWRYEEVLGPVDTLTLIGGGHVAFALSRAAAPLGFRIRVIDNRPGLRTLLDNTQAHERLVILFDDVHRYVPQGPHSYVGIMTSSHASDLTALERLLPYSFRYLGMLGSAAKARRTMREMEARGADPERLARVHAPIGLPIGSRAPEEIAISIAAQLIQVRNGVD